MTYFTPYYRTILENGLFYEEEPDFTYSPYLLFCIRTKMEPILTRFLGAEYGLGFITVEKDQKMMLAIEVRLGADPVDVVADFGEETSKEIQDYLNLFTSRDQFTCLVYRVDEPMILEDGRVIPMDWLSNILPYISIPKHFNPFVDDLGLQVDLSRFPDYSDEYGRVLDNVITQIQQMYNNGYILQGAPIAEKWNLELADSEGLLYRAKWKDPSFAPDLVAFLRQRLGEEKLIRLNLKRKYRDSVLADLEKLGFQYQVIGTQLLVQAESYQQAQTVSGIVSNASNLSNLSNATNLIS